MLKYTLSNRNLVCELVSQHSVKMFSNNSKMLLIELAFSRAEFIFRPYIWLLIYIHNHLLTQISR